jgi:hypothetical protein
MQEYLLHVQSRQLIKTLLGHFKDDGTYLASLLICTCFLRIRIQNNREPIRIMGFDDQKLKKTKIKMNFFKIFFLSKITI